MLNKSIIHASCKGNKGDLPYQDYVSVQEGSSYSFAIVADGLGSSSSSARGANIICSMLVERFNSVGGYLFDIKEEVEKAVENWYSYFEKLGVSANECLTTCSFIFIDHLYNIAKIGFVGDSPIFYRRNGGKVLSTITEKDFLNETSCVGTDRRPVFTIQEIPFVGKLDFLICTDGFGDEIIIEKVDALFDYFFEKYSKIKVNKRNKLLKQELVSSVQDINNDDKSIVFGWIHDERN